MARRKLANTDIEKFDDEVGHVLHRPDRYIGSVNPVTKKRWIYLNGKKELKELTYVSGFLKLFDEVISNSVDEAIKNDFKIGNKISVTPGIGVFDPSVTVEDNGRGIPIVFDKHDKKWVPELVFTSLRTGSNFDDDNNAELLGRNGEGVSLTNYFSTDFYIETRDGKQIYEQEFHNNVSDIHHPSIKKNKNKSGTTVTYCPDISRFPNIPWGVEPCHLLNQMIITRVIDLAFVFPEIKFSIRNDNIHVTPLKRALKEDDRCLAVIETEKIRLIVGHTTERVPNEAWVNGVDTTQGAHIEYLYGKLVDHVRAWVNRKYKFNIKPADIRDRLYLCFSLKFPHPQFDSQTKERLTSPVKDFDYLIDEVITDKFLKSITENEGFIEDLTEVYKLKAEKKVKQAIKKSKKRKIAKLVEATSKDTENNILMICEGDSAKSEIINVRNPNIAAVPIRGKLLNVYDKKDLEVVNNQELRDLMQVIGLEMGKKSDNINYGKIGLLTDMDYDGNSIAGLLINFFYKYWPELFHENRIVRVLSPLYVASSKKGDNHLRFYDHASFDKWSNETDTKDWTTKYYKGLGSLGTKEYEIVLNEMEYIELTVGQETKNMIELLYSQNTEARKKWLSEVK